MQSQAHYPKHYCGVFGIFGHPNAAELTYYGLYALQHRGQESAGIVTCHEGKFYKHHGMGLVPQIFNGEILHGLIGDRAIGHTRYSTTGSSQLKNAQPLTVDCVRGQIAIAHNGNLTNAARLRDELENKGVPFQTTVDSEIILMMLAQPTLNGVENTLVQTLRRIEGAYSIVIMTEKELIGARDQFGFRPLSIGRTANGAWVLSSETTAFDLIHAEFVRDVTGHELIKMRVLNAAQSTLAYLGLLCGFDYTYEDVRDPVLFDFVRRMLETETAPCLPSGTGVDIKAYVAQTFARLHNKAIAHRNHQIATDGSQKIVQRLLNPIRDRMARGGSYDHLAAAVAAWMAYLCAASSRFGARWAPDDPWGERVRRIADETGPQSAILTARILALDAIFGADLGKNETFCSTIAGHLAAFLSGDPRPRLEALAARAPSG